MTPETPAKLPDHSVFLCGQKTGYLTPNNAKVWMPELNDWSGGLSTGLFAVGSWYAVPHGICVPIAELEGSEQCVNPFMTPETTPTPKFAIGDVVQLKSGGPLMTVTVIEDSSVYVRWHAPDYSILTDVLPQECLRIDELPKP